MSNAEIYSTLHRLWMGHIIYRKKHRKIKSMNKRKATWMTASDSQASVTLEKCIWIIHSNLYVDLMHVRWKYQGFFLSFSLSRSVCALSLFLLLFFSLILHFHHKFPANRTFHANYETSKHTERAKESTVISKLWARVIRNGEDIDKRGVAFIQKSLIMWNEIYFSCSNVFNNKRTNNGVHSPQMQGTQRRLRTHRAIQNRKYKLLKRPVKSNANSHATCTIQSGRETCDIANSIDKMTSETYVNYVNFFAHKRSFDILHSHCAHTHTKLH